MKYCIIGTLKVISAIAISCIIILSYFGSCIGLGVLVSWLHNIKTYDINTGCHYNATICNDIIGTMCSDDGKCNIYTEYFPLMCYMDGKYPKFGCMLLGIGPSCLLFFVLAMIITGLLIYFGNKNTDDIEKKLLGDDAIVIIN